MRVLFVFILPSGGMDTLNRMRIKALRSVGIESCLLYFRRGSGSSNHSADTPVFYTTDHEEIRYILQFYSFDAIVLTSFFMQLELFRHLGFTKPIIFENQGFGPKEQAHQALVHAQPYLNAHADALLYPRTPHIEASFSALYPHKFHFSFSNPFDVDQFGYRPNPRVPVPILAWIGRLDDNKNWRDFLRLGSVVAQSVPNVALWVFSDPTLADPGEPAQLHAMTIELGLLSRVTQYHNIPHAQMADFLSQVGDSGGMLCMTSKTEGATAYAALEALSCRCPVVTTDSDGVREAIIDEVTGLYYQHGDIAGGTSQINRLISDVNLRKKLIRNGEKHVRNEFSMGKYANHFAVMLRYMGIGS
ncbi:glycosyltransferase family 4 protein [Cohnella luojiensis]|uniref:Glycosyltransferase family 1 protein n=1 Tax=Cohnella luojiensis TaxID=652876 RepID=A0A4Y8M1G8_9BACL|nr:glycosyltransferase family 4 protein [Cohnella luojiensis]TFE27843.1 glycosyltransferase family 1 protein [Cohnella luojiensis]